MTCFLDDDLRTGRVLGRRYGRRGRLFYLFGDYSCLRLEAYQDRRHNDHVPSRCFLSVGVRALQLEDAYLSRFALSSLVGCWKWMQVS